MEIKISEIIRFLEQKHMPFRFEGNMDGVITGFAPIKAYRENCITWLKSDRIPYDTTQPIALCVMKEGLSVHARAKVFTEEPKRIFFKILEEFFSLERKTGISRNSVVETDQIGKEVFIGHHCFIGRDVVIGDGVTIQNNVQIECPTRIGDGTVISSGVVIGTDGFGYYKDENGLYQNVPHFGGVTIGKQVVIGANTCIDRGTMEDTYIGDYVKIDNLCHIAHNVRIEKNSLVIALSMLGGSSVIKENGYIAPGVMVKNQIVIGKDSFVGMGAVALDDVPSHKVVVGVPAQVLRDRSEEE